MKQKKNLNKANPQVVICKKLRNNEKKNHCKPRNCNNITYICKWE